MFKRGTLISDVVGGITVAVVALPLALGFGISSMPGSDMGAMAGLYGAVFTGVFATAFGATNGLINGPTAAMVVVLANTFAATGAAGFFTAMLIAALLQILLGVLRLGKYVNYIPKPVVVGFTNGIGVTIFIGQFENFSTGPAVACLVAGIMLVPLLLSLFGKCRAGVCKSIAAASGAVFKFVPVSLLGLIIAAVAAAFYFPEARCLSGITSGFPALVVPEVLASAGQLQWGIVLQSAVSLCLLASIETLLSAVVVDDMLEQHSDADRELIGQGIGNGIAAIFGGLMGTGAIVRSAVNVNAGGRTKLSGIIHAIVIFCVVLFLAPLAQKIPYAALAGVLMVTAVRMIQVNSFKLIHTVPKSDAFVMLLTMAVTVGKDLIWGVAAGTVCAAILFTIKVGKTSTVHAEHTSHAPIHIMTVPGPLFFGSIKSLIDNIERHDHTVVILNMSRVSVIDETAVRLLLDLKEKMDKTGRKLILTRLTPKVRQTFCSMTNSCSRIIFEDAQSAAAYAEAFLEASAGRTYV